MLFRYLLYSLGAALLLTLAAVAPRAAEAADKINCANCGKQVDKAKAIKVVLDGRVYYVCSRDCVEKLKKKKKP